MKTSGIFENVTRHLRHWHEKGDEIMGVVPLLMLKLPMNGWAALSGWGVSGI